MESERGDGSASALLKPMRRSRFRFFLLLLAFFTAVGLSAYLLVGVLAVPEAPSKQDTSPPTPPRGVQAAAISSDQVEVHWNASMDDVGVAGYRIYRCAGDCRLQSWPGSFVRVGTATSGTTFVDTTVRPDAAYTYLVTAFDAAANESAPGPPPRTRGFRPVMHDHQPHTLPLGYTARVDVTYPPAVAPGVTFEIRRLLTLNPRIGIGHTDIHYRTNNDDAYGQWAFPGRGGLENAVTVTAPTTPGNIFFYAETHLSWPGLVSTHDSPLCSPWFQIVVTNGKPLDIQPTSLPVGKIGTPYKAQINGVGETPGPFRWGITHGGRLPPGLSIDSRKGTISGEPTAGGTYSPTVMVEAQSGAIATRTFTLTTQ